MIQVRTWLFAVALLAVWIAADLNRPVRRDMRAFDAREVARIETKMWRSYYGGNRISLFLELADLMQRQYGMPFWRSGLAAYYAARAAVVFQRGHERADYLKALPYLEHFYDLVERTSAATFDVKQAASLELEWWIIHRERAKHSRADLERALAKLQAEIYRQPSDAFASHARARAEAMLLRDARAESGGVSGREWQGIGELLDRSRMDLRSAVGRVR